MKANRSFPPPPTFSYHIDTWDPLVPTLGPRPLHLHGERQTDMTKTLPSNKLRLRAVMIKTMYYGQVGLNRSIARSCGI